MELGAILSAIVILSSGLGGWLRGRTEGQANALNVASDVVGMLSVQVAEYRAQLDESEEKVEELKRAIEALEGDCPHCGRPR